MKTLITLLTLVTLMGCALEPEFQAVPGPQGAPGQNGANGQDGATGAQGAKGDQGAIGETGAQGPQGSAGINGTDGTSPSVVQLCGGCVAAYPSVFPEIAICASGKLLAVYSQNGGFLVELHDGYYSSNGINCTCSFHVSGCTVN